MGTRLSGLVLTLLVAAAGCAPGAQGPGDAPGAWQMTPPTASARVPVASIRVVAMDALLSELPAERLRDVSVDDPVYHRRKRYSGFPLPLVLERAFGAVAAPESWELVFRCVDGYSPSMPLSHASDLATVALRDHDAPADRSWVEMKVGRNEVSPAPAYLVWEGDDPAQTAARPWPYQLVGLELRPLSAALPVADADVPAAARRGGELFSQACIKCHSLNLVGGTLGPELNVPANVTEYWHPEALRRFIVNPASIRQGSRMPAFDSVSAADLSSLLEYLRFASQHKVALSPSSSP